MARCEAAEARRATGSDRPRGGDCGVARGGGGERIYIHTTKTFLPPSWRRARSRTTALPREASFQDVQNAVLRDRGSGPSPIERGLDRIARDREAFGARTQPKARTRFQLAHGRLPFSSALINGHDCHLLPLPAAFTRTLHECIDRVIVPIRQRQQHACLLTNRRLSIITRLLNMFNGH